ncbi:MAG TPA: hypothetical protein VK183_02550 [Flavobacterium sp.]|nr:hypothetical protein [Flavobacterium sp.]
MHYLTRSFLWVLIALGHPLYSQQNNLTGSPYSLYGLGIRNDAGIGRFPGLAGTGIALDGTEDLNIANPAALAEMPLHSFLTDIGIKYLNSDQQTENDDNRSRNFGFSNFALAFPAHKGGNVAAVLIPYTEVGYVLGEIREYIEGSQESYTSYVTGSGGLNQFSLTYSFTVGNRLRFGVTPDVLFGTINQTQRSYLGSSIMTIKDEYRYSGYRLNFGGLYKLGAGSSFGMVVRAPSSISGQRNRLATSTQEGVVFEEVSGDADPFKFPLDLSGGYAKHFRNMIVNVDASYSFWNATHQSDNTGKFIDEVTLGMGLQVLERRPKTYWDRIEYRAGLQFNSGNLEVDGGAISEWKASIGLGLPLHMRSASRLNISLSYADRGKVTDVLIRDRSVLLTLNFSFRDTWFIKPKID